MDNLELKQAIDAKFTEVKTALEAKQKDFEKVENSIDDPKARLDAATSIEGKAMAEYVKTIQEQVNGFEARFKEQDNRKHVSLEEQISKAINSDEAQAACNKRGHLMLH